jgi:hypothetical protein
VARKLTGYRVALGSTLIRSGSRDAGRACFRRAAFDATAPLCGRLKAGVALTFGERALRLIPRRGKREGGVLRSAVRAPSAAPC